MGVGIVLGVDVWWAVLGAVPDRAGGPVTISGLGGPYL